ncbi:MAG: putative Ig domain-containing protein [Comamonadaceae bacterium]|nr:putative Ig domain-containing protein [Comamonadaceae bacterium]
MARTARLHTSRHRHHPRLPAEHRRRRPSPARSASAARPAAEAPRPAAAQPDDDPGILTPPAPREPRINGPSVYGVRPGHPFLYRIPATGDRPMRFSAQDLPAGLTLDAATGIIRGTIADATPRAHHDHHRCAPTPGAAPSAAFRIVVGDTLALTPPMGWNDWYTFYEKPSDALMRKAADIMVQSGMADHGYQYVNIDDCLDGAGRGTDDPDEQGPARDERGMINAEPPLPGHEGDDRLHPRPRA